MSMEKQFANTINDSTLAILSGVLPCRQVIGMQSMGHKHHQAKQPQQAGSGPSDDKHAPLPLRFQTEMGADFFKSDLNIPAANVPGHDLQHGNSRVSTEEGKRRALAIGIA
jgi:hypothetical protein